MSKFEINILQANGRRVNWAICEAAEVAGHWKNAKVCNCADDAVVSLHVYDGHLLISEEYAGGMWRPQSLEQLIGSKHA